MCRRAKLLSQVKRGEVEQATNRLLSESWTPDELDHQADSDGSALFWAALRGYTLLVELLLARGASVNERSMASGGTPLHGAADNGHVDVTRILLQWGADVRSTNYFKDTACHLAAYRGNAEIVSLLLRAGTECGAINARSNSVLDEAKAGQYMLAGGQHALVQYLVTSHEATGSRGFDARDNGVGGGPHGSERGVKPASSPERRNVVDLRMIDTYMADSRLGIWDRRDTTERRDFASSDNSRHCPTCKCSVHIEQTRR